MPVRVSIITPSYNQGRFVEQTIQSVVSQSWGLLEYIVVDGGSTDNTVQVLQRYRDRLTWISERDRGQADAVNKGIALSTGDIVGWLNSDDVYYPGAVEAAVQFFEDHPECDLVYGDAYHIDQNGAVIELYPTEPFDFAHLTETCFICQPAVFMRRQVFERFGLLDANLRYCMDYEYWIRLAQCGARFGWLRMVLAGSRLHPAAKTLARRVAVHSEINSMLRRRLGRVPDRWLFNYAHALADRWGVSRQSRIFPLVVSALSLAAALRWNHAISRTMAVTVRDWTAAGLRQMLPRRAV